MDRGKIWLVVPPKVGVPLYLGSVAVIALLVHFALLTHTTWFTAYWNGAAGRAKTAELLPTQQAPGAVALPALAAK